MFKKYFSIFLFRKCFFDKYLSKTCFRKKTISKNNFQKICFEEKFENYQHFEISLTSKSMRLLFHKKRGETFWGTSFVRSAKTFFFEIALLEVFRKLKNIGDDLTYYYFAYQLVNLRITAESNILLGWHRLLDPTGHCTNSGSDLLDPTVYLHFISWLDGGGLAPLCK